MEDKLIKEVFKGMKRELPKRGVCPDEADLACFAEGTMDDKGLERIEEHLVSCSKCCDYVVSLNKVINFSEEERLPEIGYAIVAWNDTYPRSAQGWVFKTELSLDRGREVRASIRLGSRAPFQVCVTNWMSLPDPPGETLKPSAENCLHRAYWEDGELKYRTATPQDIADWITFNLENLRVRPREMGSNEDQQCHCDKES